MPGEVRRGKDASTSPPHTSRRCFRSSLRTRSTGLNRNNTVDHCSDETRGRGDDDISSRGDDVRNRGDDLRNRGDDLNSRRDDIRSRGNDIRGRGDATSLSCEATDILDLPRSLKRHRPPTPPSPPGLTSPSPPGLTSRGNIGHLVNGARVNTEMTSSCQGSFQEAVRTGNAYELQRLLEGGDEPGGVGGSKGDGSFGRRRVDVNGYDREGQTALHQSCLDGNLELVQLLVRFGADVRLANRDGWNALHIATFSGRSDIVMYLVNAYKR